ncbi:MAG: ATP-binding protein [Chloroflexi bacterium]|nr:ATP-binding protein [Chloroflexota bacterium]
MSSRLGDHLRLARRSDIVGREEEKQLFRYALTSDTPPFFLFYIFGPGGVGKTTLVREFRAIAAELNITAVYLDSRNIEPSPDAFARALAAGLGGVSPDALESRLTQESRVVLFIDTFELLAPLEGWLREIFFPQLPENVFTVITGRNPLAAEWRLDPGWRSLINHLSLRNLSNEESLGYLQRRRIPEAEQHAVLDFTHGHPLALSLVADVYQQRPNFHFQPSDVPDILKMLLEQFVQKVPGPAHRAALEACALVHMMTEAVLSAMLGLPDAHELFDWLRELSFIEAGAQGIFPHDLAREALINDLRWRNPDWYTELHNRARTYYGTRLQQGGALEQQSILYDYIYLHRDNALVRPFYEWQGSGSALPDRMKADDGPILRAMVQAFEGDESVKLLDYWLERQPDAFLLFRGSDHEPCGFTLFLPLDQIDETDAQRDPAIRKAWNVVHKRTSLRVGETATYFRFWMVRDTYQAVAPIQSQIFVNMVRHYLTTPGLVYTFLPCREPDFWSPMFAYADLARLTELDFSVDGQMYGVYGHDWRSVPPLAWLALMGERELNTAPITPPTPVEQMIVLDADRFAEAVRDALKSLHRPIALRENPLLRSRLVVEKVGLQADPGQRVATLQGAIHAAAELLRAAPRDVKFYRVLHHTYFQPATTQEMAAEVLDLPFSTYRRHLKSATERLTEYLWQQEIGA